MFTPAVTCSIKCHLLEELEEKFDFFPPKDVT